MTAASPPIVRIHNDPDALSHAAAELFVSLAQGAARARGRFSVAVSGGTTPRGLYALLGSSPYLNRVDWKRTHVFWADERCVPANHQDSNFKLVFDAVLSKAAIPLEENIHRIRGEEGPERAAQAYEQELRSFFGTTELPVFDLVILGAGEDGHTASLFPGNAALREKGRLAVPVRLEPPTHDRATLTLPVLNHAAQVLFLATGRQKAVVVHEIMEDGNPRQYPAGMVRSVHGTTTWLIDRDAAEKLSSKIAV